MDGHSRFGPDVSYPVEIAQAGTGEAIGQVDTTQGGAFVVHADGTSIPAEAGMPIYLGDVIETKAGGTIGVVFADNSTFSLAEQGKMTIDDMVYDPATAQGHSLVSVAEGVFTFVSGEIAKTGVDAMQIDTPVATIGIRGSAGGGNIVNPQLLDPNSTVPPSGTFSNFRDPFTGQAGELFINTPTGSQTLNGVNATTNVPNPFVPPSPPIVLPGAVVQNVFAPAVRSLPAPRAAGNQQGGLGNLTTNDPAPAGQGAQQAAAQAAAVQAFAQAVAQGGNLATALAAATQIAQQAATRFGVDPAALDGFTPQVAANEIVASGENGFIVPADPDMICDRILQLSNPDTRKQFGQRIREKVLSEFGWNTVMERYMALYGSLK